jgi:hypothetical protein
MASLLALPVELLQHVALFLPFSAILKLQCVNREFYEAYNDRLVMQSAARNGFYNTAGVVDRLIDMYSGAKRVALEPAQLEWHDGELLLHGLSTKEAGKVAYAVEQCTKGVMAQGNDWTICASKEQAIHGICEWLPQLLALHHPAALALEPDTFLRAHGKIRETIDNEAAAPRASARGQRPQSSIPTTSREQHVDMINANFILNCITLQRISSSLDPKEIPRQFAEYFFPAKIGFGVPISESDEIQVIGDTLGRLRERVPGYSQHTGSATFDIAKASAVILPMIVSLSMQFPTFGRPVDLPKPSKMPFHTLMDIPPVFGDSTVPFSTCHLHKMTSPEFLCGEWMGYYSDRRGYRGFSAHAEFDPPMRDIRLVASKPLNEDVKVRGVSAEIDLQSTGVDLHGHFTLEGQVLENGTVNMKKTYVAAGWSWMWTGCVTPFGLVGFWGRTRGNSTGGYFWIWKQEWC